MTLKSEQGGAAASSARVPDAPAENGAPEHPRPNRPVVGVLRLLAAAALLVAIAFQVVEKAINNDLIPAEYFSYFTIQSSMIAIVVLAVGGMLALRHPVHPQL